MRNIVIHLVKLKRVSIIFIIIPLIIGMTEVCWSCRRRYTVNLFVVPEPRERPVRARSVRLRQVGEV